MRRKLSKAYIGFALSTIVVGLAFWGAIIYVVVHFVSKYW